MDFNINGNIYLVKNNKLNFENDKYETKEYKILLLDDTVKHYRINDEVVRYKDYKTARNELDRLENGLKLNLDSLNLFN